MNLVADQLVDAALALPSEGKLALAELLLESMDDGERTPLHESWREVVRRRSDDLKSGRVTGATWDEVKQAARARHR